MKNSLTYLALIALLVVVIVFGALYSIDLKYMDEGKPVFFSTWGKKYSHVDEAETLKIETALKDYIVSEHEATSKNANEKWFCADKIYLLLRNDDTYTAYAWIYAAGYINRYNGEMLEGGSFSSPHRFKLKKVNDVFEVVEVIVPQDGTLYEQDLKLYFPENVVSQILKAETDGTVDRLQIDIQNQIAEVNK